MDSVIELLDGNASQVLIIAFALVVTQVIVRRFLGLLVHKIVQRHHYTTERAGQQREETIMSVFGTSTAVILWIIGLFMVLAALQVDLGALLTGAGLIGIIVGFGAQSTIKNLLAGVFVILENQYRVGDIVTINGVSGVVEVLTIRITKLRDLDGDLHVIQNGDINIITNHTFGYSSVNIDIGVSYDSNIDAVEKTINKVGEELAADTHWSSRFIEPIKFLRVDEFSDSAIVIKSLGKVAPAAQWEVAGEFRRRLKQAFDKAGIEIPFPQRVVHQAKTAKAAHSHSR